MEARWCGAESGAGRVYSWAWLARGCGRRSWSRKKGYTSLAGVGAGPGANLQHINVSFREQSRRTLSTH